MDHSGRLLLNLLEMHSPQVLMNGEEVLSMEESTQLHAGEEAGTSGELLSTPVVLGGQSCMMSIAFP